MIQHPILQVPTPVGAAVVADASAGPDLAHAGHWR